MHIWEDLIIDKHSGALIGFISLGDITDHIIKFEKTLTEDKLPKPKLEKTMTAFIIRGLLKIEHISFTSFSKS